MITKSCEVCNREFKCYAAAAARRKTCSIQCGIIIRSSVLTINKCLACNSDTTNEMYCSNKCQMSRRSEDRKRYNEQLFALGKLSNRSIIKKILINQSGHICCNCNNTTWLGKPITLWVDHIDGNASNNNPNNFQLICPNCDSQSDTFMAKNKGNGRKSRGLI